MSEQGTENWIDLYLKYTDHTEPCVLYREWVAVSVIASVLRRKCSLDWGQTAYPNLYVVLVGPSGARKGTAMYYGRYFLDKLKIKVSSDAPTREGLIRAIASATDNLTDPENPSLIDTHSSLTVFSPEFTVFIGYDNKQLMMDLCDWYDCASKWEYGPKTEKLRDTIHGVWVNILGATTPDLIQKTMPLDAVGGGLTARIMFVYAEKKGKPVAAPFLSKEDEELRGKLLADLEVISLIRGKYHVTEAFLERWVEWYHYQDVNPPFKDSRFEGYFNRRPWTALKLSMIMNAARGGGMLIDVVDFNKALNLLERTEVKMRRVFAGVGQRDDAGTMGAVMSLIATSKEITFDDIYKVFYRDLTPEGLAGIILSLEKIGFCTEVLQNKKTIIKYKEEL